MFRIFSAALLLVCSAWSSQADDLVLHDYQGSWEDARFSVENAIVDQGLVIDYVSHVGEMLERTKEDVGSDVTLFDQADIFVFCSAKVSREVMEANPLNIAFCPYGIFVSEREGLVQIGYRSYPDGAMKKVQALLEEIVQEALSF